MQTTCQHGQTGETISPNGPLFDLGRTVATAAVVERIPPMELFRAFMAHSHGEWGSVCAADAKANNDALVSGARIMSVFHVPVSTGEGWLTVWLITEADRSITTALFPEED